MALHVVSTRTSSSGSHTRKRKDSLPILHSELKSLHRYLDGEFQNYWDIRRFGGNKIGLKKINCPLCPYEPKLAARVGENFVWYSYRKYQAVLTHVIDAHLKREALTHRRILADQARREAKKIAAA